MQGTASLTETIAMKAVFEPQTSNLRGWARCLGRAKLTSTLRAELASVSAAMSAGADIIRHSVPADHSCLFASVAYLCQGISGEVELRTAGRKLREVCAQAVLADPDPASRAIMLGHDSVEAYVQWIRNETHWGGEPEVLMLAEHFETELVIVSCESLSVLRYAEGGKNGTGYLL